MGVLAAGLAIAGCGGSGATKPAPSQSVALAEAKRVVTPCEEAARRLRAIAPPAALLAAARSSPRAAAFARRVEPLGARSYAVEARLVARLHSVKVSATYRVGLERITADAELEASRMKALEHSLRSQSAAGEAAPLLLRFGEADGGCRVPRHAIEG